MIQRLTQILAILLLSFTLHAQSFIGGSIIKSTPVGDFANKNLSQEAGFAKPGISLGLFFNNYFKENLGYGISFDFGNNPVDVEAWELKLMETGVSNPNVGAFDYEIFNIYGSFLAKTKLAKNLDIKSGINLGIMNVSYPAISYSDETIDSLYSATLFSEGGDGTAICFGGELAISYNINKIKLQIGADYIYGRPRFNLYNTTAGSQDFFIINTALLRSCFKLCYKL